MKRRAVYPGSFDPWTEGHEEILETAARMFDEVIVVIGKSNNKPLRRFERQSMIEAIEKTFAERGINNAKVTFHDGVIALYAKQMGATCLVRGARNQTDFQHEIDLAKSIKRKFSLDTAVLFTLEHGTISSSVVYEYFGYDIDIFDDVPGPVLEVMMAAREAKDKK